MLYADHLFDRAAAAGDGNAKGDHLDTARQNPLYRAPEAPAVPQLPPELAYIWTWFTQLNQKRQCGMAVNALTSAEILAWQARHGIRFDPFEEAAIDRLDALFIYRQNKKDK
ncbi:hypothetical protein [Janthinobacterium sp. UMAB-60]|uniref:phage tail assembly chaperone n=1 Tax=Janthinobacterium sp. UMAB-60 TaxID=1365365 RepID=UPI001C56FAC8|nr:hypothetical protein [Janthinobacterium sp. UMAB-60]